MDCDTQFEPSFFHYIIVPTAIIEYTYLPNFMDGCRKGRLKD